MGISQESSVQSPVSRIKGTGFQINDSTTQPFNYISWGVSVATTVIGCRMGGPK